jgi:heavy metal sensor kinase
VASSRARLSIGVKLLLRYTAVLSITVTVVSVFVYSQVTRRINRDARLLVEIQTQDLAEAYRGQLEEHGADGVIARLDEHAQRLVRGADPSLRLGIAFVDDGGGRAVQAGSLASREVPLSRSLLEGERSSELRAVNLGGRFAYLCGTTRVPGGFIQVVMNTERYAENIRHIRDVFLLSLPLVLVLTAVGGWLLVRGSLRPISQITQTARRISGANLEESVPVTGSGDELDQLASTLNEMLLRIHESVERMHRFNANAAHELRTPLTAMSSQLEVTMEKNREPEEYRKVMAAVLERVRALAESVDAMLRLARTEAGLDPAHRSPTSVRPLVETVWEFFDPLAQEGGVDFRVGQVPDAVVIGDASWLYQLFSNLVSNAIKFTPAGGSVSIDGEVEPGWLRVVIRDTGPGIPPDEIERVFDRYQRAEGLRTGFGLGLPIALEIARAHGGRIEVESSPGVGTAFTVWLPLADPEVAAA